jgi:hypothetical protein
MGLAAFRPVTDTFPLAWEHDPALDREREDFAHAYELACDTGDWSAISQPGMRPALFIFRLIDAHHLRLLNDIEAGPALQTELGFRMSLVKIEDWGDDSGPKLDRKPDPAYPALGPLVSKPAQQFLDAISLAAGMRVGAITHSLGERVLIRSSGVRPLSEKG